MQSSSSTNLPGWPATLSPSLSASSSTSGTGSCAEPVVAAVRPSRVGTTAESVATAACPAKARASAARKAGNPPRPANAWICYRSARVHELKASVEYAKLPQADISKVIGQLWREETPEVRRHYELEAEKKKAEHKEKYPDYIFRPVRREAVRQTRKKRAAPPPTAPPPQPLGAVPSVLQPVPIDGRQSFLNSEALELPPLPDLPKTPITAPHVQPADLPIPPAVSLAEVEPIPDYSTPESSPWVTYDASTAASSLYFLPSPPWSAADLAPAAPQPIYHHLPNSLHLDALVVAPSFSPSFAYLPAVGFDDPYLSPPASATIADFDDLWHEAVASTDHVEPPYTY
ncbi:hypothetical protein JCM3770_006789 [Rhodotorula araucariae]